MVVMVMSNYENWKIWTEVDDLEEAVMLMKRRTRAWKMNVFTNRDKEITQLIYTDPDSGTCESMYLMETKE